MQVRGTMIKGVELTLVEVDARELAHILTQYNIQAAAGKLGTGSSIDSQIKLASELSTLIKQRLES